MILAALLDCSMERTAGIHSCRRLRINKRDRIVVAIFQTLLMASLAELCSVWPVAGGQQ